MGAINATRGTGFLTLRTLYHGQPVQNCLSFGWDVQNLGFIDCQTTSIDMERSPRVGEITGTILVDGAPPPANTTYAQADHPNGVNYGFADANGRFRFLSFAGPQTGTIHKDSQLATVDIGTINANAAPIGNVTVRPLYEGQPITGCVGLEFYLNNIWGIYCESGVSGIPAGIYTLAEYIHGRMTPVLVTVSSGQTTVVVELSGWAGEITGTMKINGNIAPVNTIYAVADHPVTAGYVAGQTRDLGAVGLTTLNGAITAKNGSLPFNTWTIRLDNTGTLTQTFGAACTPAVTSTDPLVAGYLLIPGSSGTVQVNINFTGRAANGGAASNNRSYALQLP